MIPGYLDEVNRVRTALESTWQQRHMSVPAVKWHKRGSRPRHPRIRRRLHPPMVEGDGKAPMGKVLFDFGVSN